MSTSPEKNHLHRVFIDSSDSLQSYLYHALGSREESADLLHDCYVRLARSKKILPSEDDTRAYLFTIARNLVTDSFRKRSTRGYDKQLDIETVELPDSGPTPPEVLEYHRLRKQVKAAILKMPETTRIVFGMKRYEALSNNEIANRLSISTRTVERKMVEAMALIRQHMDGNNGRK
ncbi:MAG: sigma-70 family RNA polymerase sigma factor [Tissierellales bacterium]